MQIPVNSLIRNDEVHLDILRLDAIDPITGGNKLYKWKYNQAQAVQQGFKRILTFGGAWSNHIAAAALAGQRAELEVIGVIRGEEPIQYSQTLMFARECGMKLHFVSREQYRNKYDAIFMDELRNRWGDFFMVPEGGSNAHGVRGCMEIISDMLKDYDVYCCALGSGGTSAGIALSLPTGKEVMAFSALKNGAYLEQEIVRLQAACALAYNLPLFSPTVKVITEFAGRGYGKVDNELFDFVQQFQDKYGIPLDYIYTGKMLRGIITLLQRGEWRNKRILVIHSGGIQGNAGFVNPSK